MKIIISIYEILENVLNLFVLITSLIAFSQSQEEIKNQKEIKKIKKLRRTKRRNKKVPNSRRNRHR